MISVYGVFIKERCVYVGRTSNLKSRRIAHVRRFRKLFGGEPDIRVLQNVSIERAPYVEWQMIRMYKEMGQADFNSDPAFSYREPENPITGKRAERAHQILELIGQGIPRKEIAGRLATTESEVSKICRANGIFAIAGRKSGSGCGYGVKLSKEQYEEILRRDDANVPHAEIGRAFGISRERVRQICVAAGHPPRARRSVEQSALKRAANKIARIEQRVTKKFTPSPLTLKWSAHWKRGLTIRQIADKFGKTRLHAGVNIIRMRRRFPALFPYRRPANLRWMGKRTWEIKKAA